MVRRANPYHRPLLSPTFQDLRLECFQNYVANVIHGRTYKGFCKAEVSILWNEITQFERYPTTDFKNVARRTVHAISSEIIIYLTSKYPKDCADMAEENWKKQAVEYRLTEEDERGLNDYAQTTKANPTDILRDIIGEGYKVSITLSSSNDSICVTATGTDKARYNSDKFISAWSSDLTEAVYMLGYKIFVIFDGKAWKGKTKTANWG